MDKGSLMEYLSTVCDAENAIYACDEAINALKKQKLDYHKITCPLEPEIITPESINTGYTRSNFAKVFEIVFVHIFRLIFFIFIYVLSLTFLRDTIDEAILLVGSVILTFTAGTSLGYWIPDILIDKPRIRKIDNQVKTAVDEKNHQAQEEFKLRKDKYNQAIIVENLFFAGMDHAISEKKELRETINSELQQLYAMNIIYPTFRNMVAVNQIREYLEMGVCDTLEGPDGAYAQYLQDVRTNRICDSITDLKKNLMSALSALAMTQAALVHELRETNSNIQQMNNSLNQGLSDMQRSLEAAQHATAGQFEACMQQANNSLKSIEQSMSTASYNQYIALRQSNVRKYLLKAPN